MADSNQPQQQQHHHHQFNGLGQVSEVVVPTIQISTNGIECQTEVEEVTEDLLQQALGVAVSTFQQDGVEYQAVDGVVSVVTHGDCFEGTELVANVVEEDDTVATLVQQVEAAEGEAFEVPEYAVSIVDDTVSVEQIEELGLTNNAENMCESAMIVTEDLNEELEQTVAEEPKDDSLNGQTFTLLTTDSDNKETLRVTLMPTNAKSGAPLGSSQNPIRIIQQGNQYTPVQQLSNDQLSQIMQVVQQQQVTKTAQEGSGSSTLFNPDTNTKIVYRVIYPSELHKTPGGETPVTGSIVTQSQGQQTLAIGAKRTYKKRRLEDEEDKASDAPELSREEKDARKKHRPRTRSGRVSKPPKHMIKDYKHIHTVDWDDDPYDDSDGGYSDFKYSEDERDRDNEDSNDLDFSAGLGSRRPKNWKCAFCKKGYIGQGGLDRHYRLNPEHAKDNTEVNTSVSNGLGFSGHFSEDSNTQDSLNTATSNNNTSTSNSTTTPVTVKHGRGNYRNVARGPWAAYKNDALKRKRKLKEFLRYCTDEDLMETVLPRLSKVITLWEFLLAKIEKGNPSRPNVADIFKDFSTLHKKVEGVCQKYLEPLYPNQIVEQKNRVQIDNAAIAHSLGLEVQTYCAKPIDITDESFHRQTAKPTQFTNVTNHSGPPRSVHLISKEDLIGQSNKRFVINAPETMTTCADGLQVVKIPIPPMTSLVKATNSPAVSSKIGVPKVSVTAIQQVKPQNSLLRQAFKLVTPSPEDNLRPIHMQNVKNPNQIKTQNLLPSIAKPNTNLTDSTIFLSKAVSTSTNSMLTNSNPVSILNSMALNHKQSIRQSILNSNSSQITIQNVPLSIANSFSPQTAITQHSLLSTPAQSTQITIPVMLPQGTEQISLELPSSLAETMIDSSGVLASLSQTVSSGSGDTVTTTTLTEPQMVMNSTSALIDTSVGLTIGEAANAESVQSFVSSSVDPGKSQVFTVEGLGEVELPAHIDPNNITQFIQHDGELTAFTNGTEVLAEDQFIEGQVITDSNIYQTEDGIFIIQSPNGTTMELQGAQALPIETVQALFAMDTEGQSEQSVLQVTEFEDMPS